jgi:hypothetical protein
MLRLGGDIRTSKSAMSLFCHRPSKDYGPWGQSTINSFLSRASLIRERVSVTQWNPEEDIDPWQDAQTKALLSEALGQGMGDEGVGIYHNGKEKAKKAIGN